ncbi:MULTISPECIES: DddA-like double-stranded DNA deaminase toxin [unclassified Streptomyces]|uniref:DddA-like double-stranded DNA deaminase toxin n=1 Tax=unclassified Streptomyces TaxID=2593676 RepID=UPI0037FAFEC6
MKAVKESVKSFSFKEGGPTSGLGVAADGRIYLTQSGNKVLDKELLKIANERLREVGIRRGTSTSARASDAEQKFASIMIRDNIKKAEVVINNPSGPCRQPMGCDQVLNAMLGGRQLTVHWPNGQGGYRSWTYGNGGVGMGGK